MLFACAALAVAFYLPDQNASADWFTFNGNLAGNRYSALKQIDVSNVRNLRQVAVFETGQPVSFQTGPVVVDGVMYCTTYKHTYAIDAATGKLKWKHVADVAMAGLSNNRGVAYDNGRVFRGYGNGEFAAFDAATGNRLWLKKVGRPELGESMPSAPVAWHDKVFIGNAGGDNKGVTGHVYALDQATGERVWQFDTVPKTGPAAATWKNKKLPPAGGATWSSYSIDTATGLLYLSAGNPAPDFDISLRPGKNLYTNCVIALDAETGQLRGYVQPTKNDEHDWDIAAAPALFTSRAGKKIAAVGGKDGMLYGIDNRMPRNSEMRILYSTPITRRLNVNVPLSATRATRFAPGSQGGVEWNGPSYDPGKNLIFIPATDWPTTVRLAPRHKIIAVENGKSWSGADDGSFGKLDKTWAGYLTAVDADSGKVRWKYKAAAPLVAGVTSSAGGLVFSADAVGNVRAMNAGTGKVLWSTSTGRPCGGGVVSYAVGGKQYIAVATGLISAIWPAKPTTAKIVIYALP